MFKTMLRSFRLRVLSFRPLESDPMKVSEAFPSKYLKAADIPPGREAVCTICAVTMEGIDYDGTKKPVLYFMGHTRGIFLNRTNAESLAEALGEEMDNWIGKRIGIFATTTLFRDEEPPNCEDGAGLTVSSAEETRGAVMQSIRDNIYRAITMAEFMMKFTVYPM